MAKNYGFKIMAILVNYQIIYASFTNKLKSRTRFTNLFTKRAVSKFQASKFSVESRLRRS